MKLKLKDILPNPFRDLKTNPLIDSKVEELVGSINLTGFWDNVVVRMNASGKAELAYGHHRLAAAIRAKITEADFIVKDLSDAMMIQIMDNENRETYGSTPLSLIESVKAVVNSLAKGTIPAFVLDPKVRKDSIRYAPSFVPGKDVDPKRGPDHAYTAINIAEFLGRVKSKGDGKKPEDCIIAALNALHLKEAGHFSDDLLVTKDRTGAKVPITTNELLHITSGIKKDVERVEANKGKSRAEINVWVEKQRELEQKRKEREAKEKETRDELVRKQLAATEEEDAKAIKKLAQKMREQAANAKLKELADKEKMKAIEVKIEAAKTKAAAVKVEDTYTPVRREVERVLFKLDNVLTGSFCEDVKALAKLPINTNDRERLRQAALNVSNWYKEYVAIQFIPPLKGTAVLKELRKREVAKRKLEENTSERKVLEPSKSKRSSTKR